MTISEARESHLCARPPRRDHVVNGGLGECPSCGEPVRWVLLPTGKHIAVQTAPNPAGTVAVHGARTGVLHGRVITGQQPAESYDVLYRVHAAACAARPEPAPVREPEPTLF